MHKAEQILAAIALALAGLATVGGRVSRTREYFNSTAPNISIRLASIDPQSEISNAFLDSFVEVELVTTVQGSAKDLDSQLLAVDAEAYAAIMADRTLGGSAITVDPQSMTVESTSDADLPTAIAFRRYRVHIRHSITNAEV